MGSITSLNNRRNQQFKEKEKEKEKRKDNLSRNRIKGLVFCSFCGSLASFFAIRKEDAKKIPCCCECIPPDTKKIPWILSIEKF